MGEKKFVPTDIYNKSLGFTTTNDDLWSNGLDITQKRLKGIPNLFGFMERPITSPLQYEKMEKRIVAYIEGVSQNKALWGADEVAFVDVAMLP